MDNQLFDNVKVLELKSAREEEDDITDEEQDDDDPGHGDIASACNNAFSHLEQALPDDLFPGNELDVVDNGCKIHETVRDKHIFF